MIIAAGPGECFKTLGVHWDTGSDSLHISTPAIDNNKTPTKCQIASIVAKVFDILGWFAPAILPAKILLQDIWKLKLAWDDPVNSEMADMDERFISHHISFYSKVSGTRTWASIWTSAPWILRCLYLSSWWSGIFEKFAC